MESKRPIHDQVRLDPIFGEIALIALIAGIVALSLAPITAGTMQRFYFAYLLSFSFFLSLSLGGIFFVLLQHLTRAGWSVGIRRTAENIACTMPVFILLLIPILVSVLTGHGDLYRWTGHTSSNAPGHAGGLHKEWFLNVPFFLARCAIYFICWSWMGVWFWKRSVQQDQSADPALSSRMQGVSAPATLVLAFTLTFAAFDLLMALDAEWFSTMFGVYFFAGCAVGIFATLILLSTALQMFGYLKETITAEHMHDLGKFLFAFTFFWGYIAFSQFMLLWYANIPEETGWLVRRGASSAGPNGWTPVALALLFGHLILPFAGLLSRHVKRANKFLAFWAAWMLVFHWLDLYWIIMPELDGLVHFGLPEVLCFAGVGGIFIAALLKIALRASLSPVGDPRAYESLVFENI